MKFFLGNIPEGTTSDSIDRHMRSKNVKATHLHVFRSRKTDKLAAVIEVRDADVEKIKEEYFWPDKVYCRQWYD
jgi:hypothetical protein